MAEPAGETQRSLVRLAVGLRTALELDRRRVRLAAHDDADQIDQATDIDGRDRLLLFPICTARLAWLSSGTVVISSVSESGLR